MKVGRLAGYHSSASRREQEIEREGSNVQPKDDIYRKNTWDLC